MKRRERVLPALVRGRRGGENKEEGEIFFLEGLKKKFHLLSSWPGVDFLVRDFLYPLY